MKKLFLVVMLGMVFMSVALADTGITIPADQPICRLYGLIKTLGTVVGVIVAAYAGFTLAISTGIEERSRAKQLLGGVIIGISIIWLAPMIVNTLVGGSGICGW